MELKATRLLPRHGVKKILIRGTNWIGDTIMSLPAVHAIRESYPQAEISMLVKPWVADVFSFCPDVDRLLLYMRPGEHDGVQGIFRLAGQLKKNNFDLAIYLQNAIEAAIIGWLARIPLRAGYDSDCRGIFLTHSVHRTKEIRTVYQVDYYLEMVKALGCTINSREIKLDSGRIPGDEILERYHIGKGALLVGMAPGASYGPAKRWFPERFGAVASLLKKDFNAKVLLFGSASDRGVAQIIENALGGDALNLAGRTGLKDVVSLISKCSVFLTNDSGLMHIAGALGVPTLAIYGSTNPLTTPPPGKESVIIYKDVPCSPCLKKVCPTDFRCMEEISISEVYSKARSILINHGSKPQGV